MKEKMIEYLKLHYEEAQYDDVILDFINAFFDQYQPERSKREDYESRCGALNSIEI